MSFVERYFFSNSTNGNAREPVELFAQSAVFDGLMLGPRWGVPREPDLPGLEYQRTRFGISARADGRVITRRDMHRPPSDWEDLLADYVIVRSTLVALAAARWPIAINILKNIPRGTTTSADTLKQTLAAIRVAATGAPASVTLDDAQLEQL